MERLAHFEVWSSGIDEAVQGIGADPYSGAATTGLRVPLAATTKLSTRYLFMACGFQLAPNTRARILGIRQYATLGVRQTALSAPPIVLEQQIITPNFALPDGNISWHLRFLGPKVLDRFRIGAGPSDLDNFKFRMSHNPALLYQSASVPLGGFYTALTDYVPPNGGKPHGEPLAHLGTWHDLRWPWRGDDSWNSVDMAVEGRGFYGLFASVRQSSGVYPIPTLATVRDAGPEQNFIQNFGTSTFSELTSGVIFWKIAGSLRVAIEECDSIGKRGRGR